MNETKIIKKIDKAGRIVIPKPIREQLKINDYDTLTIKVIDNHIEISKKEGE